MQALIIISLLLIFAQLMFWVVAVSISEPNNRYTATTYSPYRSSKEIRDGFFMALVPLWPLAFMLYNKYKEFEEAEKKKTNK